MKNVLKGYIAQNMPEMTFAALKSKGLDITQIEQHFVERNEFQKNLLAQNRQYSLEEYEKKMNQSDSDIRKILEMIVSNF